MKPFVHLIWSGVLLITALLVLPVAEVSATDPPSTDFVADRLTSQEERVGPALQVRYSLQSIKPAQPGHGRLEIQYVRTSDILFMERTSKTLDPQGEWKTREVVRHRYERATKSYRSLGTDATGQRTAGKVMSGVSATVFRRTETIDPPLYGLIGIPLRDRIKEGVVQTEQETVDGHACWKVDIPSRSFGGSEVGWSIYLDPEVGFCPRRIIQTDVRDGKTDTSTYNFRDYRDVGNGVWFPMEVVGEYGGSGMMVKVESVSVGTAVPADQLDVDFPSGTWVTDLSANTQYQEP